MSTPKTKTPRLTVAEAASTASSVIARKPTIALLFIILALVDMAALTSLFLSHSGPFNQILGPIIRRLWGERFLHYPDNFLLLPKLYGYAHLGILVTAGILISAVVIKKVEGIVRGTGDVTTVSVLGKAFGRYFPLLFIWLPLFILMHYSTRLLLPALPPNQGVRFAAVFALLLVIQSLTSLVFPAIMTSGKNFIMATAEGLVLAVKHLGSLVLLLFIPVLLATAVSIAKAMAPFWMGIHPDLVLVVLYASIVVTTAVDLFITVATATFYLKARQ